MLKEKRFVRELVAHKVEKLPSHERDEEKDRCYAIIHLVRQGLVTNLEAVDMIMSGRIV